MTGKHPARLHITVWAEAAPNPPKNRRVTPPVALGELPLSETSVARTLQSAGYLTALVGKWHLGAGGHAAEAHGFDVNVGGTHWGAPTSFFFPYRGAGTFGEEYRFVPGLGLGKPGEYLTDRLTDEAIRFMDAAGERPFFLYLAHHAPHTPIEAPTNLVQRYTGRIQPVLHHKNAAYAAMVDSLDANVGRVLKHIADRGLSERTLIVFTSDNGGFINDFKQQTVTDNFPLRSGKGSLYEGGIRVPLIVRWPGVTPSGSTCAESVVSTDLYYTLLEAAGIADPTHAVDGISLLPVLKNPSARLGRPELFFHYPHYYQTTTPVSAIMSGDWKLLEYHEDKRVELYNLSGDLGEKDNLSARQPDRAREMLQRLEAWRRSVGAQMPEPNPNFKPAKGKQR
jgi:arylsulfatase A